MNNLAPICLFTYNRLEETKQTVDALKNNYLAVKSDLFVFSDGAKNDVTQVKVNQVREYLKTISGFNSISIFESQNNKGLADSIIEGVTKIIEKFGKVIVIEDDLLTSPNFLNFMNEGLDFYRFNVHIISICGYNMKIKDVRGDDYPYDIFFAKRSASWGWATWSDKWNGIDWEINDFKDTFKDRKAIKDFNQMGSDMFKMLKDQQLGLNNSWAIRYCYHQYKNNLYSVFPILSKVRNIGFSSEATHTFQKYNRFDVELDTELKVNFKFSDEVVLNKRILKSFRGINSILMRIYSKIRNKVNNI
ncbi:sugar transferase [Zunongwangia sp.]|uniref:sugar transferase n=1 Tax=Zunongwangia sp. TaxID=1965325 RepID=UPI003AA81E8C